MKYQLKGKTILVVDDDPSSLILLCELIEPTEAIVLTARCRESTINKVLNNKIDLILLDLKLGDTTGFNLLPEIRKISGDICVIAQTAFAFKTDATKCYDAGFDEYISKPIHAGTLYSMLEKHLM